MNGVRKDTKEFFIGLARYRKLGTGQYAFFVAKVGSYAPGLMSSQTAE
jgi:hypothetical protein